MTFRGADCHLPPTGIVTSQVQHPIHQARQPHGQGHLHRLHGLSDSFSWDVEVKGPDLTTCPGESGSAQRGSAPYGGAMVNLSLTGVSPARGDPQHKVHLC